MSIALDPRVAAFVQARHGLLIDGQSRPALSGADMAVHNPATGEELARVAVAAKADVDQAVAAARRAFEGNWAAQRPADRERLLLKLADLLELHGEELAQLETLNNGKSINLSRAIEVGAGVEYTRYMAGWATKIEGKSLDVSIGAIPGGKYRVYTVPEPVGVVGAIVPWNFPLMMALWKIVPALACGCTVVLKPADETPLTALRLGQLCLEAGIPPGVVNIVTGVGAEAGAALAAHPGIDKLAFTGSTPVGKLIGHAAVENMTRFTLELGGKSPVIVLDDTALDNAAAGAAGAIFFNQGQVCTAGSRLYVQRKSFDQVLERLHGIAGSLSIGPGLDPSAQINPLISAKQQRRVLGMIDSGRAQGASVICGGEAHGEQGFFVKPTVIANVRPDMQVVREEIFGPVLVATAFDEIDEVVRLANDSPYGLAASIWSNDLKQVMGLIPRLKAGTVWVNAHNLLDPSMPFGGFKQSGIGREMGHAAIEAFTENKSVCIAY
ncbi:aldehyde dehydrogenase family protein [Pseudomonas sp. JM0905a]|uniref:aldehyde dehydrogenase family protein n=1 Tax=Pseudomonas sp. JM0905a TaxID=2772484 RepID=UPI0016887806|nr:aldehyde dehydrogenase family protein [Pseudomonas sp. JM0905a]MBD2837776.1 aldehyde dehydrogenase family protein [Pseudomonas sp. JM0905a]